MQKNRYTSKRYCQISKKYKQQNKIRVQCHRDELKETHEAIKSEKKGMPHVEIENIQK